MAATGHENVVAKMHMYEVFCFAQTGKTKTKLISFRLYHLQKPVKILCYMDLV